MQRYTDVVQRTNGNAVSGAAVTVYDSTGALATIYSNNSYSAQSNPVYTGSDGEYQFYAANGRYTLSITRTGFSTETKEILLFDPVDGINTAEDPGEGGYWPDVTAEAKINRMRDRVFIGDAAPGLGTFAVQDQGTEWMATDAAGASWAIRSSQALVMSSIGSLALTGASRSGSRAAAGLGAAGATIGVSGFVINDVALGTAWGLYSDVQHETGRWSTGLEIAAKNKGADVTPGPYGLGDCLHGIWFAGGGDPVYGGSPTNPSGSAMTVIKNGHTWNRGIVFGADALTGSDGVTGTATAIVMARGHQVSWQYAGGTVGAFIRSDVDAASSSVFQIFDDNQVQWRGNNSKPFFQIRCPVGGAANYVDMQGVASGSGVVVGAAGDDTNVDIRIAPKGTGVVSFGTFTSNADAPVTGYVTIKDAAGNTRKLAVIA